MIFNEAEVIVATRELHLTGLQNARHDIWVAWGCAVDASRCDRAYAVPAPLFELQLDSALAQMQTQDKKRVKSWSRSMLHIKVRHYFGFCMLSKKWTLMRGLAEEGDSKVGGSRDTKRLFNCTRIKIRW